MSSQSLSELYGVHHTLASYSVREALSVFDLEVFWIERFCFLLFNTF